MIRSASALATPPHDVVPLPACASQKGVTMTRKLAFLFICFIASIGCNRSNNAEVAQAKADVEAARAEAAKEKARADSAAAELIKQKARADAAEGELAKLKAAQAMPKPVDDDRRAAEWVLKVDGSVKVVSDGVSLVVKKDGKLPDGPIKVVEITLSSPKASDDGTPILTGLKDLRVLSFVNAGTGASGVNNTAITNFEFVQQLPALENLSVEGISDAQISQIKGLTKLKYLSAGHFFGNAKLTDAGLESLKELKRLEVLALYGCFNITDAGLQNLKELSSLRVLVLDRCGRIGDAGLEHLKGLSKLEELRLGAPGATKVTEAGVKSLQAALPKCKITLK
jgi:hypothetical protein